MWVRSGVTPPVLIAGMIAMTAPTANAQADIQIAATVAPVHSLVAMVSAGIAEPAMIIRPGASPHDYAMRPSEARALDEADVVFWVGEGLEPWMAKAVTTLAGDAVAVELGDVDGIEVLAFREGGIWSEEEHDDHNHGHDHGAGIDPHLWLDPDNALAWLEVIATTLASADPAHAEVYRDNAIKAGQRIETTVAAMATRLQPIKDKPYAVFHDAYQYFEHKFDLHPLGAVSLSDADQPGPAHLIKVREVMKESGAVCIFAEPQFGPKLIETVIEGTDVAVGTLDPIGAGLQPGAELYLNLLDGLAENLVDCLG